MVDIPGDHFSILRQDEADMNVIVTALKVKLAPFGWTEQVKRDQKQYSVASVRGRRVPRWQSSAWMPGGGARM